MNFLKDKLKVEKTNYAIHKMVCYPVESVIHPLKNCSQMVTA